ncbi:hypothetical protein [Legionella shakespearei]|uniref:Secreted protein n=1 Tax=Legionella shakespearei DSM 23087 TaxID=1122169 RepID=A0A0W0Z742_9GAMM|nr:hypothetical protein [Legionella shakespearei]KTD64936.1 hypothetical protein Lsha_0305 [Legionella shakespearei DSM 23087]
MIKFNIKAISCAVLTSISLQSFAEETIKVTVKTNDKRAAAIGFSVEKKNSGSLGNSHTGRGPKDKSYQFGYKLDSIFGPSIDCGFLVLTRDSVVTLIKDGGKCQGILD